MDKITIGAKKAVNKVIYGISKVFINFNKRIKGVRKSKNIYPIAGKKEVNYQVCFPTAEFKFQPLPIIFYFHGGGWMEYDKCFYHTFCKRLAKMGYVVANVNYPLSPKADMHEIIHDSIETIINAKEYLEYNYNADKSKIILAGDSAGAQIASIVAGLFTAGNIQTIYPEFKCEKLQISELLLFYGAYDLETLLLTQFPSIELYVEAVMKNGFLVEEEMKKYSPITYLTEKFPRSLVVSGESDKLHSSQSKVFYDKLKMLGVEAECLFFDESVKSSMHGFIAFDDFKSNEKTREVIKKFLTKYNEEAE